MGTTGPNEAGENWRKRAILEDLMSILKKVHPNLLEMKHANPVIF